MYKRIHGNLGPFVPPPVRQGSGKLTRFACSNNASTLSAMLTKGPQLPNECLLYMEEPFLLYWQYYVIKTAAPHEIIYIKIPPKSISAIGLVWLGGIIVFTGLLFLSASNVESRRCALQNKHLFENPWVGAHSVRTENHCLSTQSVRVWFAVLTIGDASPRTKDFLPNAHL